MPAAVLALGWGSRLVLFEVPLIGEQVGVADVSAGVCMQHAPGRKPGDVGHCQLTVWQPQ